MKKLISIVLTLVILILPVGAFADNAASENMQRVLLVVKGRVDIPAQLTEFSSYISDRNDKTYYNFEWTDEAYEKSLSVSCDSEGRITSYYNYMNDLSDKKISNFSKSDIIAYAKEFILKTLPEAFVNENDVLIYDELSYDARGNMRYSLRFDRYKNSVEVKDNYAEITVCVAEDKLFVRNMNVSYSYNAVFEEGAAQTENYIEKYKAAFPAELVYRDEYNFDAPKGMPQTKPVLVYRIKDDNIGYIDAGTGEVVVEDELDNEVYKELSAQDSAASGGSGSRNETLTPQEMEEIGKVEGLLSIKDIESKLKKLPYVELPSEMTLESSELSKNNYGEYIYRLYYSSENKESYRYVHVSANAKDGKFLSISQSMKYSAQTDEPLTEKEIEGANVKIAEFLDAAAEDELGECAGSEENIYANNVTKEYVRIVNGVKYIDDGIYISFDAKNNCIRSYSLDFADGEFEDVTKAIGEEAAYGKILEYAPIKQLYIASGGKYKKVFSLDSRSIQLDAVTGEIMDGYSNEKKEYSYTDVSGHWAEEAAQKLSEIQIGFEGDKLIPDKAVTQKEFLSFAASGIINKYYEDYSDDELYNILISDGILTEEEKSPDSAVSREDAFIYIIRFAGLEKVAQLSDIYKISYADGNLLSEGKIGYAAILSGLGVICGDGGYLRPTAPLTRAEAVVMLYRYLVKL